MHVKRIADFTLPFAVAILIVAAAALTSQAQAPPDYTPCATEGGQCKFTGTKNVKYGANGVFIDTVATNWFDCNFTAFGNDPVPNVLKQCYVSVADFNPGGLTQSEIDCQNGLQKKVKWMQTSLPSADVWAEQPLKALCKGTTNATATVDCFKKAMADGKSPQGGIEQCTSTPLPAGRQIDFILYDNNPEDEVATLDESDPLSVEVINKPLSPDDLSKVMKWIADKTASQMSPYCYKSSYGRGAGETLGCAAGLEKNGQLCYTPCRSGFGGAGPVCYSTCPAGLKDIGALCQKPASYGRGAGYALWDKNKCSKDNPQGCEQNGLLFYPKCKAGFHAVGCCVCSPDCPAGMTDTGTDCVKNSYGRGAGSPIQGCGPGQEQNGLLCYPNCKSGFYGSGPVCYQNCPTTQPEACAAGCAIDQTTCGVTTAVMVYSVLNAAYSLYTLGSAAKANITELKALRGSALPASVTKAPIGVAASARLAAQRADAGRLTKMYNALKRGASFVEKGASSAAKRAKFFVGEDTIETIAKTKNTLTQVNKTRAVYTGSARLVYSYSDQYAKHFAELTSPEVNQAISSRFGPIGARQIKMEWARVNLSLMLEAKGMETAQLVLSVISAIDPTGLTGVASAFTHPVCFLDTPFPAVTVRYKD